MKKIIIVLGLVIGLSSAGLYAENANACAKAKDCPVPAQKCCKCTSDEKCVCVANDCACPAKAKCEKAKAECKKDKASCEKAKKCSK